MARLNTEFNYRYQVIGETVWAKIETLKGFLGGRKRAAVLEEVALLKYQAKLAELTYLQETGGPTHTQLNLRAEILELESFQEVQAESFLQNKDEIACLERLLAEYYVIAEPTRIHGYSDDMMFELNAANEFTAVVCREIQSEIIANGRPSPAKLHNAMSNPYTFKVLQDMKIIPDNAFLAKPNDDPVVAYLFLTKEKENLPGVENVSAQSH